MRHPDQDEARRLWIEVIAEERLDPRNWLYEASRLKRAADLVGSQFQAEAGQWLKTASAEDFDGEGIQGAHELAGPALMLIGYAIEVLAKGLIIAVDASDATINRITTQHIDAALLEEAGVELQGGEAFLVDAKLYHSVRWAGRYPVPRPHDGAKYFEQLWESHGSIFSNPGAISTDMYRQACELFERMRRQLAALLDAA